MSFAMDNFKLVLEARDQEAFGIGCSIAFMDCNKASHFSKTKNSFTLYWHGVAGTQPLPFEMSVGSAQTFLWEWLENHAEYPEEPDLDGSCSRGFLLEAGHDRLYNGQESGRYAMLKVTAIWAEHHK